MPEIGIRDLKARTSEIMCEVREQGVSYVVTHRGTPAGLLIPMPENDAAKTYTRQRTDAEIWAGLKRMGEEIRKGWEPGLTIDELRSSTTSECIFWIRCRSKTIQSLCLRFCLPKSPQA